MDEHTYIDVGDNGIVDGIIEGGVVPVLHDTEII